MFQLLSLIPTLILSFFSATSIKFYPIKFYIDPFLATNSAYLQSVLPGYVEDINYILAKNTNAQLTFDPTTGIIITSNPPFTNNINGLLPTTNFEIWAYIAPSQYNFSYGGYMSYDISGCGGLNGLHWKQVYDPNNLTSSELNDYWTQINNMLHEIGHVFGAAVGEYYNLCTIKDMTTMLPTQDINCNDTNDLYWKDKQDFLLDPMLKKPYLSSRQEYLQVVQYSNLTGAFINNVYRNSAPSIAYQNIIIKTLPNANIKIWSIRGIPPNYQPQLLVDSFSDGEGNLTFSWENNNPHNNYDFLRLIKVYKFGYIFQPKYISVFDADIERLINDNTQMVITINPESSTSIKLLSFTAR